MTAPRGSAPTDAEMEIPDFLLRTPQAAPDITARRKRLLAAGYAPAPANGKAVHIPGWSSLQPTEADIEAWARDRPGDTNTGILTGTTPAVDIDVQDPGVSIELQRLLRSMIGGGRVIWRVGQTPKHAVLFQTDAPFKKKATPIFISPDGKEHKVEILCDGQQLIAYGTHPGTGGPYQWHDGEPGEVRRDELPHLSEAGAKKFIAKAIEVMKARGWTVEKPKPQADPAKPAPTTSANGGPERNYAATALDRNAAELTGAAEGERNNKLNALAYRMGRMTVRGWIGRDVVARRLLEAAQGCGLGDAEARATIASGLTAGEAEPHPDLNGPGAAPAAQGGCGVVVRRMSDVEARPVNWLWSQRLARGKLTLVAGEPGIGKSQLTIDVHARLSRGAAWPDVYKAPVGNSMILSAEDAAADTLRPRLEAAGADLDRVFIVDAVRDKDAQRSFNLQRDLELLGRKITEIGDVVMITIDPITSYMGKIDGHSTTDVRGVLEPLAAFAEQHNVAILAVSHPPKGAADKAMHSVTGSLAYVAAARMVFIIVAEPESDRRLFLCAKNNLGPMPFGLAYRLVQRNVASGIIASHVKWDGLVNVSADQALREEREAASGRATALSEAMDFLRELLSKGPMAQTEVAAAAKDRGQAWRTVQRAKVALGIKSEKQGLNSGWVWSLPTAETLLNSPAAGR